jgi:hypothetical protein
MAAALMVGINFPQSRLHLGSVPGGEVEGLVGCVFRLFGGEADVLFCGVGFRNMEGG